MDWGCERWLGDALIVGEEGGALVGWGRWSVGGEGATWMDDLRHWQPIWMTATAAYSKLAVNWSKVRVGLSEDVLKCESKNTAFLCSTHCCARY